MPSGPPACQLQASAPRIDATACSGSLTGWATPMASTNRKSTRALTPSTDNGRRTGGGQSSPLGLEQMAELAAGIIAPDVAASGLPAHWPTPATRDGKGGYLGGRIRDGELSTDTLDVAAQLTGWPTPTAANADGGQMPKDCGPTGLRANGTKATVSLQGIARLSGWPTPLEDDANNATRATGAYQSLTRTAQMSGWATPKSMDGENNIASLEAAEKEAARKSWSNDLRVAAFGTTDSSRKTVELASWPTPMASEAGHGHAGDWSASQTCITNIVLGKGRMPDGTVVKAADARPIGPARLTASGEILTGSSAAMASGGQLNPAFSLWLMGFPTEWASCAPQGTQLYRKSQRNS